MDNSPMQPIQPNLLTRVKHLFCKKTKSQTAEETINTSILNAASLDNDNCDNLIDLWSKQVDIVTHFSDATLKIRLYAISVLVTLITLITAITQATNSNVERLVIYLITFFTLCIAWAITWMIDKSYYSKHFDNALDELTCLENKISMNNSFIEKISPTSGIKPIMRKSRIYGIDPSTLFYFVPQAILLFGFSINWIELSIHGKFQSEPLFVTIQKAEQKPNTNEIGIYVYNSNSLELSEVIVQVSPNGPIHIAGTKPHGRLYRLAPKLPPLSKSQLIVIDPSPEFRVEYTIDVISARTSPYMEDQSRKLDLPKLINSFSSK